MKRTILQTKLENLYETSNANFGNNASILGEITRIAGNRGYSHLKRAELIKERLGEVGELNNAETEYLAKLGETSYGYIKDAVKSGREIKNTFKAARRVAEINRDYSIISEIRSELENKAAQSEIVEAEEIYTAPQNSRKVTTSPGFWRRTKKAAAGIAAALVLGLSFGNGGNGKLENSVLAARESYDVQLVSKPYSDDKKIVEKVADTPDSELNQLREQYKIVYQEKEALEKKLAIAGRPDDVVYKEASDAAKNEMARTAVPKEEYTNLEKRLEQTEETLEKTRGEVAKAQGEKSDLTNVLRIKNSECEVAMAHEKRLEAQIGEQGRIIGKYEKEQDARENDAKLAREKEQKRLDEARKIHQIVGGENFQLPEWPIAYTTIDRVVEEKKGFFGKEKRERFEIGDVRLLEFMPQNGFSLIDTKPEFRQLADAISGIYHPEKVDSNKFEELVESEKGDVGFARQLEEGSDSFDRMAMFISDHLASKKQDEMKGVVFMKDKFGKTVAIGSYKDIVKLKAARYEK